MNEKPTAHTCTMDKEWMPECCAQWRMGSVCANTGGECRFRKVRTEEQSKEGGAA
jgi:hypothetical protein